MNNQDNYKKAVDQIHANDDLKEKVIEKVRKHKAQKKIMYLKYLSVCAVFLLVVGIGTTYYNKVTIPPDGPGAMTPEHKTQIIAMNKDLPRFKSLEELTEVLKENTYFTTNGLYDGAILESATDTSATVKSEAKQVEDLSNNSRNSDHSTTNVQVENVDEADIVKTDGEYIYYITQGLVYIIKADNLEIVQKMDFKGDKEGFTANEIYINDNKLIILGNSYSYNENVSNSKQRYYYAIDSKTMTEAKVYDISDKKEPKEIRTVSLDGCYKDSRMIGDNIYLISSKNAYYYDGIKEEELLPRIYDSNSGEEKLAVTDIAYFEGTESYSFMIVAGFDINNENPVCTETFFGASDTIYASENNLYLTQAVYDGGWFAANSSNIIYKFKLDNSKIELLCKGEVKGYLNNQFSMDEYEGNLRIATTHGYDEEATNQLFILDENLQEIGKIENMAVGEKIYAVRFIGKVGYIVTFEQVDPLFVIDLSDPRNPVVRGELKIPGYSSYLHPYDETHIIGIGHNTESNGYGGVTNSNMKMSMFDVSDLENPVELFNISIGGRYADSNILYDHKALFENKARNLIGFPVTLREYRASEDKDAFVAYKVDLENNTFERYGQISHDIDYRTNIDRAIYIGDILYTLAEYQIKSYNLDNFEELETLEIEEIEDYTGTIMEDIMPLEMNVKE